MILKKTIFIIILFLTYSIGVYSQAPEEVSKFKDLFEVPEENPDYSFVRNSTNEFSQIMSLGFLFYKYFLSSQDGVRCTFYPSCSVYAIQSIQEKGWFFGVLNAIDRLTRCNGFSQEKYEIHSETHLLFDPVK
ncbi:membrane protein insertion efficiency factor YidD [Bacteroidota bacterium]